MPRSFATHLVFDGNAKGAIEVGEMHRVNGKLAEGGAVPVPAGDCGFSLRFALGHCQSGVF